MAIRSEGRRDDHVRDEQESPFADASGARRSLFALPEDKAGSGWSQPVSQELRGHGTSQGRTSPDDQAKFPPPASQASPAMQASTRPSPQNIGDRGGNRENGSAEERALSSPPPRSTAPTAGGAAGSEFFAAAYHEQLTAFLDFLVRNDTATGRRRRPPPTLYITRTVYTYYGPGFSSAPPMIQSCIMKLKRLHPDWSVYLLDRRSAASLLSKDSRTLFRAALANFEGDRGSVGRNHAAEDRRGVSGAEGEVFALSLLKLLVLWERGGVFVEPTAVLTESLDWVYDEKLVDGFEEIGDATRGAPYHSGYFRTKSAMIDSSKKVGGGRGLQEELYGRGGGRPGGGEGEVVHAKKFRRVRENCGFFTKCGGRSARPAVVENGARNPEVFFFHLNRFYHTPHFARTPNSHAPAPAPFFLATKHPRTTLLNHWLQLLVKWLLLPRPDSYVDEFVGEISLERYGGSESEFLTHRAQLGCFFLLQKKYAKLCGGTIGEIDGRGKAQSSSTARQQVFTQQHSTTVVEQPLSVVHERTSSENPPTPKAPDPPEAPEDPAVDCAEELSALEFYRISTESALLRGPYWVQFMLGYDWATQHLQKDIVGEVLKLPASDGVMGVQTPRYFFQILEGWDKVGRRATFEHDVPPPSLPSAENCLLTSPVTASGSAHPVIIVTVYTVSS